MYIMNIMKIMNIMNIINIMNIMYIMNIMNNQICGKERDLTQFIRSEGSSLRFKGALKVLSALTNLFRDRLILDFIEE